MLFRSHAAALLIPFIFPDSIFLLLTSKPYGFLFSTQIIPVCENLFVNSIYYPIKKYPYHPTTLILKKLRTFFRRKCAFLPANIYIKIRFHAGRHAAALPHEPLRFKHFVFYFMLASSINICQLLATSSIFSAGVLCRPYTL